MEITKTLLQERLQHVIEEEKATQNYLNKVRTEEDKTVARLNQITGARVEIENMIAHLDAKESAKDSAVTS